MTSLAVVGAEELRAVMGGFRDGLRLHQADINRLNVYPVPDGDTGTNMALTLEAVVTELDQVDAGAGLPAVCQAIGHGSLMGARGNSGVILSQLLRGMTERMAVAADTGVQAEVLADALGHAAELARKAVVRPVEGTILTVASAAAEGAARAAKGEDAAGAASLAERDRGGPCRGGRGPGPHARAVAGAGPGRRGRRRGRRLPAPARCALARRRRAPPPRAVETPIEVDLSQLGTPVGAAGEGAGERTGEGLGEGIGDHAVGDLRYEVMYLLYAPDDSMDDFKEVWAGIGDSIVVVGGEGLWNCHIHTDDIGAAIEAGVDAGRPQRIRVTDLAEQVEEERWVREAAEAPGAGPSLEPTGPPPRTGVVAVVTGDGIGRIFRSLGVHHQVVGGQSMNPSTADLVEAVEAIGSDEVVILPNNKNIRPVAEQVDGQSGKTVRVVRTGSIVEGFAALLAYDPAADAAVNVATMGESAAPGRAGRDHPGRARHDHRRRARCTRAIGSACHATA